MVTHARRAQKPRTGEFEIAIVDGITVYRGRLLLQDGTRGKRFDFPSHMSESAARADLVRLQVDEDATHAVYKAKQERLRAEAEARGEKHDGETCDAWHARYLPSKECGKTHRRIVGSVWSKWISPVIGPKSIATLTRDDIEDVRDKLDRALDAKEIRHSTARNAWGALTGALKAAYASRDRSLRVLAAPLHFGVLPPKKGDSRQRPWLYPTEWLKLLSCADVPRDWLQLYAIALYTGLRPGELRVLTWADVDVEARTLSVSKAFDSETGEAKPPKTAHGQRMLPLQPNLLPLLRVLAAKPGELVAPLLSTIDTSEDRTATRFRTDLAAANVTRARLSADNETEEPIDFRSLRDSHATWLALTGTADKVIQRRMGHAGAGTTDRYIKAAEALDVDAIGEPFPALPSRILVVSPRLPKSAPNSRRKAHFSRGKLVARGRWTRCSPRFRWGSRDGLRRDTCHDDGERGVGGTGSDAVL